MTLISVDTTKQSVCEQCHAAADDGGDVNDVHSRPYMKQKIISTFFTRDTRCSTYTFLMNKNWDFKRWSNIETQHVNEQLRASFHRAFSVFMWLPSASSSS